MDEANKPLRILYEDRYIIVCVKLPGELSEGEAVEQSLPFRLQNHFSKIHESGVIPYPVHRLDRDVGGLMVYAKTKTAAAALTKAIQENLFGKEYIAVVKGRLENDIATLDDLLWKDVHKNKVYVVKRERKGVRKASLTYRSLYTGEEYSVVKVHLHTGRTHQIRVQFSSRQHPLLGDGKYGGGAGLPALYSCRLSFPHPINGTQLTFTDYPNNLCGISFEGIDPSVEVL